MQLLFGVGRQSIVSATLENLVLAFEIAFSSTIRAKLFLLPASSRPFQISPIDVAGHRCRSTIHCDGDP
jgi:hypothetical protein